MIGSGREVVVVIGEDRRRIAPIGTGDAARQIGRLRALQEQKIGRRGRVVEAFRRREGADLEVHRRQAVILDIGAADGRGFDARAAEIVDELVGPVVERRAVEAEAGAAEIVAAREIDAGGKLCPGRNRRVSNCTSERSERLKSPSLIVGRPFLIETFTPLACWF